VSRTDLIRLQLFMARSGVASRRRSEDLIVSGEVTVNGQVVTELGTKVSIEDEVRVSGRRIRPETRHVYLALNKPRKYLCTASDPQGRPLAIDLLGNEYSERLFSVGRLDFMSSGLIIYTNDGDFAKRISHPSSGIEKEYRVETKDPIPEDLLKQYRAGIEVEGENYALRSYRFRTPRVVHLVLVEGRNREIRRVFAHARAAVRKVHRVRIGRVRLGDLPPGAHRPLSVKEIDSLLHDAGKGSEGAR